MLCCAFLDQNHALKQKDAFSYQYSSQRSLPLGYYIMVSPDYLLSSGETPGSTWRFSRRQVSRQSSGSGKGSRPNSRSDKLSRPGSQNSKGSRQAGPRAPTPGSFGSETAGLVGPKNCTSGTKSIAVAHFAVALRKSVYETGVLTSSADSVTGLRANYMDIP